MNYNINFFRKLNIAVSSLQKLILFKKHSFICMKNRKVSGRLEKLYHFEIFVRTFEKLSGVLTQS